MTSGSIKYRRVPFPGSREVIQVLRDSALIGLIVKKSETAPYCYFAGPDNQIAYEYEHRELGRLKEMIERRPEGGAAPPVSGRPPGGGAGFPP